MHLHGRELEGNGEARRPCGETEGLLGFQIVLLCHGTVDFHGEIRPALPDLFHIGFHCARIGTEPAVRGRQKTIVLQAGCQLMLIAAR